MCGSNCSTTNINDSAAGFAYVQVSDTGTGMTPTEMDRVFEPFYTTKDVGQGTGLGLSIAYGIVREHGGWIELESVPQAGSTFRVYLPLTESES